MDKIKLGNSLIIKLQEDLIALNVKQFNIKLMEILDDEEDYNELILDLDKIENIDSVGVTFVVSLYKSTTNSNKEFRVINTNSDIIQLFKLMKLDEFFKMEN